ncbi:MAG TPA: oxidative damage protection protein [Longimicrobiaceae bacterium]
MSEVQCTRCGNTGQPLPYAPLNNELGKRVQREICQNCWSEWLKYQTMLINHYGLNLRDPDAKKFLMENMEKYLFSTGEAEQVDTSKKGTISW